ncbi:MAG: hypothetical protein FVQ77_12335 [Cytophagales bacterium]|nr:hypothetical protein [Cytophagales bacterium]
MKFKSNIKIIALLLFSINTLLMAQENKNDKLTIISLLENYQKAINTNNLEYFKPIISQNFMIGNSPPMSSYVDAYLVIGGFAKPHYLKFSCKYHRLRY